MIFSRLCTSTTTKLLLSQQLISAPLDTTQRKLLIQASAFSAILFSTGKSSQPHSDVYMNALLFKLETTSNNDLLANVFYFN